MDEILDLIESVSVGFPTYSSIRAESVKNCRFSYNGDIIEILGY